MRYIYVPSAGPQDWQWLLAKPGLHWKHGASARALAETWEAADVWPSEVKRALDAGGFAQLEPILALPEHTVPLPGGQRASQTDLFVLARRREGRLVTIAVEGKVNEPFGDTVAEWSVDASAGKTQRLGFLLDLLGLPDDERTAALRYQLLHRTGSALIEAERFGASDAIMLVHSFSRADKWWSDFEAFALALGAVPAHGSVVSAPTAAGVRLHLGWVSGTPLPDVPVRVGVRFDRAVAFARALHAEQQRKGTDIPYLAHLLAVASLVMEDGGSEDEAIAALLHDAVEDQGGKATLRRIEQQFGRTVASIVEACSDTDMTPKPPWKARKEAYVAHLATAERSTIRVSLADKLHNARAIAADLHIVGDEVWGRFNADRDEVIWYYDALASAFEARGAGPMSAELRRSVDEIRDLAA